MSRLALRVIEQSTFLARGKLEDIRLDDRGNSMMMEGATKEKSKKEISKTMGWSPINAWE